VQTRIRVGRISASGRAPARSSSRSAASWPRSPTQPTVGGAEGKFRAVIFDPFGTLVAAPTAAKRVEGSEHGLISTQPPRSNRAPGEPWRGHGSGAGLAVGLLSDASAETVEACASSDLASCFDSAGFSCAAEAIEPDGSLTYGHSTSSMSLPKTPCSMSRRASGCRTSLDDCSAFDDGQATLLSHSENTNVERPDLPPTPDGTVPCMARARPEW
jgi:hypothetical protein